MYYYFADFFIIYDKRLLLIYIGTAVGQIEIECNLKYTDLSESVVSHVWFTTQYQYIRIFLNVYRFKVMDEFLTIILHLIWE